MNDNKDSNILNKTKNTEEPEDVAKRGKKEENTNKSKIFVFSESL